MELLPIKELKDHEKNSYFFDDIEGEKWTEFLESIRTRGVIEPVIITQDKTIVSGHQRVRACKELGIPEVKCEVKLYDNDDEVILDLLETNEKQRGTVGGSALKLGRRIKEYERIYDIKLGNNQHTNNESKSLTQEGLAEQLGISNKTLHRAKKLSELPQEFQDMIEEGRLSPSVAARTIASLSDDEQTKLLSEIPALGKISQREIDNLINEIRRKDDLLNKKEIEIEFLKQQLNIEDFIKSTDEYIYMITKYTKAQNVFEKLSTKERNDFKHKMTTLIKLCEKITEDLNGVYSCR